jgi:type I restriction enzyme S subunit
MASEWKLVTLGQLTDWASGGTPPKDNPSYWGGDVPWISASAMKTGKLSQSDRTLTQSGLQNGSRLALKDDILLLVRGSELHKRIPVGIATREVAFNQDVKAIRAKNGITSQYLYYWLLGIEVDLLSKVEFTGIGAGKLDTNVLKNLPVPLPPLPEQRAIVHILGSLDDKIELNRKRNETLEAMARALFQDWFVDFGPVRAKMEGREPYLPAKIWELFPEMLDEDGKPEGWALDNLATYTNIKNGFAFKSNDWRNEGVPVVKIGSVKPSFVDLNQVSFIDAVLAQEKASFRLSIGDMLVGLTGYVGETGRVPPTTDLPMLNQRVGKFEPKGNFSSFVFASVRMPQFKVFAESKGHGSAQANVSTSDLLQYPVFNPGMEILEVFCKILDPIFSITLQNEGEKASLSLIRDTLLPKLISGEVRVGDIDMFVRGSSA